MSKERIYVVEVANQPSRLVRATHPLKALGHVAERLLGVRLATQDDLVDLVGAGTTVEDAGEDPGNGLGANGQDLDQPGLPGLAN